MALIYNVFSTIIRKHSAALNKQGETKAHHKRDSRSTAHERRVAITQLLYDGPYTDQI